MEQIPDHFDAMLATRIEKRLCGRKVVHASLIHQWPPDRLARRADSDFTQAGVIFVRMLIVMGGRYLVDPLSPCVISRGAFKTGKEKAFEHFTSVGLRTDARVG